MKDSVWCVFQKLPGDGCPALAAICRSRGVAEALVRASMPDSSAEGGASEEWTIQEWSVLDREEEREVEEIEQISHVLDPMRDGVAVPPQPGSAGPPAGDTEQ